MNARSVSVRTLPMAPSDSAILATAASSSVSRKPQHADAIDNVASQIVANPAPRTDSAAPFWLLDQSYADAGWISNSLHG